MSTSIEVHQLQKTFQTKRKAAGLDQIALSAVLTFSLYPSLLFNTTTWR
jgi:hypothetical protein